MSSIEDVDKLRGVVADALDKRFCCPKCQTPIVMKAMVPDNQRLVFHMTFEGEMVSAATIGGSIMNMRKLLQVTAKDCGEKVEVFVTNLKMVDHEVSVEFAIVKRAK